MPKPLTIKKNYELPRIILFVLLLKFSLNEHRFVQRHLTQDICKLLMKYFHTFKFFHVVKLLVQGSCVEFHFI